MIFLTYIQLFLRSNTYKQIISCGIKAKTAPTPAIIPSTTKLVDQFDAPMDNKKLEVVA